MGYCVLRRHFAWKIWPAREDHIRTCTDHSWSLAKTFWLSLWDQDLTSYISETLFNERQLRMCIHRLSCAILVDTFFWYECPFFQVSHNKQQFFWKMLYQKAAHWLLQDTQQLLVGSLIHHRLFSAIYLQFRGTLLWKRLWIELLGGSLLLLRTHYIMPLPSCPDSLNQLYNSRGLTFLSGDLCLSEVWTIY